jgi:CheY-like chemotaxis protein
MNGVPSAPHTSSLSESPGSGARRILIVDDNRDSAISLSILLSLSGYETGTAFDGEEALRVAERFSPDAVLLDLGLPRLNGYEVCRRLREVPGNTRLVVIAVTGWGLPEDRRRSADAGFDAHLLKPVDPEMLQRALRSTWH